MKSISEMIDAGEPIAYASSKEWRKNHLMSAAQHKSALSKNVVDFDIPLYAHPSAALSVPAAAVVGETERDAMRRRIYADLAKEGGGTWATYVCMDIVALEDVAFEAGKVAAPSAPDGIPTDIERGIAAILSDDTQAEAEDLALFNRSINAAKKRVEAIRLVNRLRGLVSYPVSTEINPKGWAWHMSPDAPDVIMETLDALSAALGGASHE